MRVQHVRSSEWMSEMRTSCVARRHCCPRGAFRTAVLYAAIPAGRGLRESHTAGYRAEAIAAEKEGGMRRRVQGGTHHNAQYERRTKEKGRVQGWALRNAQDGTNGEPESQIEEKNIQKSKLAQYITIHTRRDSDKGIRGHGGWRGGGGKETQP